MKSESPFQKMTFSAFLFLLKLSVSHNDHEMLSFIRNTLFTESLQIDFITKNSVVSCHPPPRAQSGLALNSACECLRGGRFCARGSGPAVAGRRRHGFDLQWPKAGRGPPAARPRVTPEGTSRRLSKGRREPAPVAGSLAVT